MSAAAASELRILLLAAGNASRYGSAKQGALIDGVPMVRRAALSALATGAGVVVVTGAYADLVSAALAGLPLALLHNEAWEQGMGGSIACGFRHLSAESPILPAAIVCLADQVLVGVSQLQRLIDAHYGAPQRIIAADLGAALGPPCLFPQFYYAELVGLAGTQGARKLLEQHAAQVERIAMPEAAVDIDTTDDYQRLLGLVPGA